MVALGALYTICTSLLFYYVARDVKWLFFVTYLFDNFVVLIPGRTADAKTSRLHSKCVWPQLCGRPSVTGHNDWLNLPLLLVSAHLQRHVQRIYFIMSLHASKWYAISCVCVCVFTPVCVCVYTDHSQIRLKGVSHKALETMSPLFQINRWTG